MPDNPWPDWKIIDDIKQGHPHLVPPQRSPVHDKDDEHEEKRSGKNSIGTANIEFSQADRRGSLVLLLKDRCDQVPGDYEKYSYPEPGVLF
jgi:hypothetical protein